MSAARKDRRHAFRWVAAVVLVSVLSCAGIAQGQQATEEQVNDFELDPIAFRGPDPKDRFKEIKIQQNLGVQIPMDLVFRNERDEEVRLGDLITDKPVVLSMVYYECPMLCTLVLNGQVAGFDGQPEDFRLGDAFTAISVSINPKERGALAQEKKDNYLADLHIENAADNWHFLTGDEEAIETLAATIGFRYYYDEPTGQYAHDSGIMIVTPKGKVSAYYLGIDYLPGNLRKALKIAGAGTIGKFLRQPSLLCYAYDPTSGTYGFVIMSALRLAGIGTVSLVVGFWVLSYAKNRRRPGSGTQTQTSS
ncbi:MAG: SCO family protein [Candidatus Hydrogenedentes bacterium]|nr:SCO family protein [Candidatus Hydrogenedentota bacterium]